MSDELERLRSRVRQLEEYHAEWQRIDKNHRDCHERDRVEIANKDAMIGGLQVNLAELQEKVDRLPIDWDTELDAYKRANDALRAEIKNLKDYGTMADEEVDRLKAEIQELREKLTS